MVYNMNKIVFVFPGVGSQYVGMAQKFHDKYQVVKDAFSEASDILKTDILNLCLDTTKKNELNELENAQTVLVTLSTAMFRVYLEEVGVLPHFCMGHSLGEYSALCAAGVIRFADALQLVHQRGLIIKNVSKTGNGTMMWVINLDPAFVAEMCQKLVEDGEEVFVSAYDSPTQSSISGNGESIMKAAKMLEKAGAIIYPLKMSGPFHSPLMHQAATEMKSLLKTFQYQPPICPVIANRNALPYEGVESVTENLAQQLVSPIRWQASINYVLAQGVRVALEIGPKDVLKFLIKKNATDIQTFTMDNQEDFKNFQERFILGKEDFVQTIGRCLGVATGSRNYNFDNTEYDELVIKPYRRIESMYATLKANQTTTENPATEKDLMEAMHLLRGILMGKKIPVQQHESLFDRVLKGKIANFQPAEHIS